MTAALDDPNDVHFRRRVKAAQAGRHFPTLDELVRGCPFMGLSLETDAQAFAERLLERLPEDGGDDRSHGRA